MSTRVQQALDGEIGRHRLRSDELAELEALEEALDGALAALRHEAPPDVTEAVMGRIHTLPRHQPVSRRVTVWTRLRAWLLTPRPLAIRPAWGLAAVAIAGVLIAWPSGEAIRTTAGPVAAPSGATAAPDPAATVVVRFTLRAPGARAVQLAGDFTDWRPEIELARAEDGIWMVEVPVRPGVHQYSFIVDGERWVTDPAAPPVPDGFGGQNSRLDVLPPTPERSL